MLQRELAGTAAEPVSEVAVVQQQLDPGGDLECVTAPQEQRVLPVAELVDEVAGGQDDGTSHRQELRQLGGQAVGVEVVGRAGLNIGVRQCEVSGCLPPGDVAEVGFAVAQGLKGAGVDAPGLGASKPDEPHSPAASL